MDFPVFGCYFGATSFSVAVYQNGKYSILTNDAGDRTTPSFVNFVGDTDIGVVGNAARQLWLKGSFGEVIGFVKRFLYYNPTTPSEATSSTGSANQLNQLIKDYRIEFSSQAQLGDSYFSVVVPDPEGQDRSLHVPVRRALTALFRKALEVCRSALSAHHLDAHADSTAQTNGAAAAAASASLLTRGKKKAAKGAAAEQAASSAPTSFPPPLAVVIAVPPSFSAPLRDLIRTCASDAGFLVLRLVHECTAALLLDEDAAAPPPLPASRTAASAPTAQAAQGSGSSEAHEATAASASAASEDASERHAEPTQCEPQTGATGEATATAFAPFASGVERVLVFRCGATSSELSLLERCRTSGLYRVRANRLYPLLCCGFLYTQALADHVVAELQRQTRSTEAFSSRQRQRVWAQAEECKQMLSVSQQASVLLDSFAGGRDFTFQITRARLESLCSGLVAQTAREVQQFLEAAGLACADVHKLVLLGGQCRMPRLGAQLAALLPAASAPENAPATATAARAPCTAAPDELVALGAALQAHLVVRALPSTERRALAKLLARRLRPEENTFPLFVHSEPVALLTLSNP